MISTTDIYYKIDITVVLHGYWDGDIIKKKELIDEALKKYIITKIQETKENESLIGEIEKNYNAGELLEILADLIPNEYHFDVLRHFVHYIIRVAAGLQGCYISWLEEDDEELIHTPYINFDESGEWKNLITHAKTDCVQIFNFVYYIFKNNFMVKNSSKQLTFSPSKEIML